MSVKITNWVWHSPSTQHLKGNTAMALLALADIADDDGHVVYARGSKRSQLALAAKARMSVATFKRVTADLIAQGFLSVTRESMRSENEYQIMTAQSERSGVSSQSVQNEPSDSSPSELSSATTPSIGRSDVRDVLLSPDESADLGTLIADDWRPNQGHIDKAASLRLDVKQEYQRFRRHAETNMRRQKNWNTAFTNWLRKGAEMAQQRQGVAPLSSGKPMPLDRMRSAVDAGRRVQEAIERGELVG